MSRRTQITLTDDQYALLKRESARSGVSLAELIRRAILSAYGRPHDDGIDGFEASFGLWADRDLDSVEYVKKLRGPGLGYRLARDDPR